MAAVATIPPPGLDCPFTLSANAADFRPGTIDQLSLPPGFAHGHKTEFVTLDMYSQLVFQYNTDVSYLRQQIMELTNKLAELDTWKLQTNSTIRNLRDQHRAIQRKIGDEMLAPMRASAFEQKMSEAEPPPTKICTVPTSVPSADEGVPCVSQGFDAEGLKVYKSSMNFATAQGGWQAMETMKVEWNLRNLSTKLKAAMGRPLVSSPFDLCGFDEVRLMVTPLMQESNTGPRSRKEKEQFSKMVCEGPLDASLTLKVPNARPCIVQYRLGVGQETIGPYECDFSNTAIDNRGSFGINWLSQMDKEFSVTVSVEMLLRTPDKSEEEEVHQRFAVIQDEEVPPLLGDTPSLPPGLPALQDPGVSTNPELDMRAEQTLMATNDLLKSQYADAASL